jgi:uncharacterized protein with ParB-like and HNH nuclease domain
MHNDGNLEISPEFQRDVVWKPTDQTRFIDSLIKQLPIPSMCLANDFKQNKWIVIDGLQRISTIIKFLGGEDWRLSQLDDVDRVIAGKNAATIKNAKSGDLRQIYSRVQNQTIPINVLRCDLSKRSHNEYLFTIFHRLNSGGVKLNNQEIRNCIYSGNLNDALKEMDSDANWRAINNMKSGENYRFSKQEGILRFFAFLERRAEYKGSVSKFLNDYMFAHRHAEKDFIDEHINLFSRVTKFLAEKIFTERPSQKIPSTVLEALMVGVASNISEIEGISIEDAQARYAALRADESVSESSLAEGLSKKDKVDRRLNAAIRIFSL